MKTTYYLVTAAAVAAAALVVHAQLPNLATPPLAPTAARAPDEVPRLPLPPITYPPDEPLVLPGLPAIPPAKAGAPALPPVAPASGTDPVIPLPPIPAAPPALPMLPGYPLPITSDPTGEPPVSPAPLRAPTPKTPFEPLVPPPAPKPVAPPAPLPAPTPVLQPPVLSVPNLPGAGNATGQPEPLAGGAKYVVLKDDKVIEGTVTLRGETVVVRQGALDRPFPKSQVQFVAESKDEVYRFVLAKVPANDAAARLKVARWCMYGGMREQALTEAREVLKLDPRNADASALARSLEQSLQQFPRENVAKMTAPQTPVFPTELRTVPPPVPVDPEPDVTPEAANLFAARVQPFLANQCVECHAKPDAGKFKLARVAPGDAGQQPTRANLRAVAAQLRKDEPVSSPLLVKALTAHGGQQVPSVASRQAVAYQALEAWTALAVGTPIMGAPAAPPPPPMPAPAPPVIPVAPPIIPPAPVFVPALPPAASAVDHVLPPIPSALPVLPPVDTRTPAPVTTPAAPVLPSIPEVVGQPTPFLPQVPEPFPRKPPLADPAPPTNATPFVPPIPHADPLTPPTATAPKPVVPRIPPATAVAPAPLPPVQPAGDTQFGTTLPPKPPVSGPTGGDEFDPAGFNQGTPRK